MALFSRFYIAIYVIGAALSFTANANLMPMFMSLLSVQGLGVATYLVAIAGLLQTIIALISVPPFAMFQNT